MYAYVIADIRAVNAKAQNHKVEREAGTDREGGREEGGRGKGGSLLALVGGRLIPILVNP